MKKILPLLLAVGLMLALAGCGDTANGTTDAPPQSAQADNATATEPNAAADDATADPFTDNPIIEAIERRNSTAREDFSGQQISEEVLHLLAWSATGQNRDGAGFVVPLAMGSEPYVSVYLAEQSGVRRYDWQSDSFEQVSDEDIRSQATLIDLSESVSAIFIFVIELDILPMDNTSWAYHTIGSMSEHQYLVAEEFGVQARYMAAVNAEAVSELLGFGEDKLPAGVMIMALK